MWWRYCTTSRVHSTLDTRWSAISQPEYEDGWEEVHITRLTSLSFCEITPESSSLYDERLEISIYPRLRANSYCSYNRNAVVVPRAHNNNDERAYFKYVKTDLHPVFIYLFY